ncbi:MAG: xylulokinase [Treponemataceae bacterium]
MKTVAGIDMGTQSLKVVLYDFETKRILASHAHPIDIISENDGTREQKTQWYDTALQECFDALPSHIKQTICALGVSGHQHGFVSLDKNGNSLYNVKLWNDTSTAKECTILTEKLGGEDAVIAEVSNLMLAGFTAPKILWLKNNKKDAFEHLHYIMLPHDYLNFKLTGSYTMEAGDASGTALLNTQMRTWSKKACDAIDPKVFSLLPPIITSEQACGHVTQEASKKFGIPVGIPVSSGGGDNMMGAIGTGTVEDGFLTMSLGTSGTLYGYSAQSLYDPQNGLSGFCSSTGGWLPLLCTMNCTVATEELRNLFSLGVKEFDDLGAKAPIGANGVVVLPFFNGERTPNLPNGRASITGLSLANTNRENICRAALESAIFAMRGGLDAFRKLGFKPKEIRLIGGGAKSPLWRQITADVMNLPVKMPVANEGESVEAAAMGAAVQALWCFSFEQGEKQSIESLCKEHIMLDSKVVMPIAENVSQYDTAYNNYVQNLEAVIPLYK